MPNRMRMNIATARRNWRPPPNLPPIDREYARRPNGMACPACLSQGRKCRSCEAEDTRAMTEEDSDA